MRKPRTKRLPPRPEGYAYDELKPLVTVALQAGVSVLLRGHPGVGKSSLAGDLARELGLPLIDIRLAQRDPAELGGVYFPDREGGTLQLLAPEWVRRACAEPCLVFLDEINAGVTRLHQAAAYQIVLERRVGPFDFHPGTKVMAAGNLEEDNAIVTTLSTALCNRFVHFILRPDVHNWLAWGAGAGIHEAILAFVRTEGDSVLYRAPTEGEYAFATPRSWEMAARMIACSDDRDWHRVVSACVGDSAAGRFMNFLRLFGRVDPEKIVLKGKVVDFTRGRQSEPSFVFATIFAVAAWLRNARKLPDTALSNIVNFLRSPGLDPEYVLLFLRQLHAQTDVVERCRALPEFRILADELVGLRLLQTGAETGAPPGDPS